MSLESKPSPRAQDSYRTDGERFTKPEHRQRSATIAAALLREASGRFINRGLKSISAPHKRRALSGQPLPFVARCRLRSFAFFETVFQRCPPGLGIGPQSLGEKQQRREFCTQRPLISTPGWRPSHMFVQSGELPTQLPVLDPSRSGIVIVRRGRMVVQRPVGRRGLATDQDPQAGDFRDKVGLSVDPHTRIVSPHRTRVKPVARVAR